MGDVRLLHGDCLDLLPDLEAGSVDAIVTDPPYGQSNEKYDRGVDSAVWRECFRAAKPSAALLSFAGNPTYHRIASDIEAAGWRVRQMWAWVYRDGMITSAYPREGFDRLRPAFDPIVFATKGKVLLEMPREGEPWDKLSGRDPSRPPFRDFGLSNRNGVRKRWKSSGHRPTCLVSDGNEPFEYFSLARTNGGSVEKNGHPNQKPLALMAWLLSKLPPGGLILDPFMGSASTGVACIQTGRRFIGMEISEEYVAIAEKRIAEARAETPLFQESP